MSIPDSVSTQPSTLPQARMSTPPPPPRQNNGGGSTQNMQNHQSQASIPVYTRDTFGISTGSSAIGTGRFTHILPLNHWLLAQDHIVFVNVQVKNNIHISYG